MVYIGLKLIFQQDSFALEQNIVQYNIHCL